MRGGWIRGLVVVALLLFAAGVRAEGESLFVGDDPVQLEAALVEGDSGLLVPLREFGFLVGVDVSEATDGSIELRWNAGRRRLQASEVLRIDGLPYVSLSWIVEISGGTARSIGGVTHVETEPATLTEFDVSEDRTVLRFDRFVPIEPLEANAETIRLRVHHCTASFTHRSFVLAEGLMERVLAQSAGRNALDISVTLREAGALHLTRFESSGFFSATIEIAETASSESILAIDERTRLHEITLDTASGESRIETVRIEDWRAHDRVRPTFSSTGSVPLSELLREEGGAVAIGVGVELDLLVVDGLPIHLAATEVQVLASDSFGRLFDLEASGSAVLEVGNDVLELDAVNRPLRYDEVIAYTPGYPGEIADGVLGGFAVLKLRGGRVVSIYRGAFVDRDPSATLIVANGEACSRLDGIYLGDDARLECLDATGEPIESAVTIESVLIRNGIAIDGASGTLPRGWSVIATDWHGGLTFLTIARNDRSSGLTRDELMSFLRGFSVPIEDAYALNDGTGSTLVLNHRGFLGFGDGDRVAVGLVLVPIAE